MGPPSASSFHDTARPCKELQILLIDDEPDFRSALATILREDGHVVREFASPTDLPPLAELADVRVLITDYDMPGENGVAFAARFHAMYPSALVVLITGDWTRWPEEYSGAYTYLHVCQKPVDYDHLHAELHAWATAVPVAGRVPRRIN